MRNAITNYVVKPLALLGLVASPLVYAGVPDQPLGADDPAPTPVVVDPVPCPDPASQGYISPDQCPEPGADYVPRSNLESTCAAEYPSTHTTTNEVPAGYIKRSDCPDTGSTAPTPYTGPTENTCENPDLMAGLGHTGAYACVTPEMKGRYKAMGIVQDELPGLCELRRDTTCIEVNPQDSCRLEDYATRLMLTRGKQQASLVVDAAVSCIADGEYFPIVEDGLLRLIMETYQGDEGGRSAIRTVVKTNLKNLGINEFDYGWVVDDAATRRLPTSW